jgi:hypothetical protein
MIALNGLPFLEYNLRALYPFAHQIIVVEGAVRPAAQLARPDGHSIDGSWEMLGTFKQAHDPEDKLILISAIDEGYSDGFWPEKDEMSQAYARRTDGNWLWQVDSDEFYRTDDMKAVIDLLGLRPETTAVSFPYREFWGGFDYCVNGQWHNYEHSAFHRLFRWGPGYRYTQHRPPTVEDNEGRDLRSLVWLDHNQMKKRGIWLYHYSYVFPKQAEQKVGYYSHVEWTQAFRDNARWMEMKYFGLRDPLFLGERGRKVVQWLERYKGPHPGAIRQLRNDLATGRRDDPQRKINDIERLLESPAYRISKLGARLYLFALWKPWRWLKSWTRKIF